MCIVDYETKKDALFLETVVLVNGESDPEMYKDSQGDVWDSRTIGQVFTTEANQTNHDLYHNKKKIDGIQTVANYRNKTVENIGGREVPVNSWRKDIMVTDNEVIELIKSNQINGISPNNTLQQNSSCVKELKNIKGNIYFNKDIENKECMNPIFTSLVPEPANGYGMNIYSYDKFLEKSKTIRGGKLSNKLKEMFKGFGESVMNLADEIEDTEQKETEVEMNKADEEQSSETITLEDVKTAVEEAIKPLNEKIDTIEKDISELKGDETEEKEEVVESQKSADVVKESDSIDDRRQEIRTAVIEKHFPDVEDDYDIWTVLMAEDCVVIENYAENKYYKVDYTADEENNITVGDLEEVEMQYVPIESSEEETEEEEPEKTVPESQKSKQPKIRTPKLESVEMEKSTDEKVNHLGMPIRTTKELAKAKNQFNF